MKTHATCGACCFPGDFLRAETVLFLADFQVLPAECLLRGGRGAGVESKKRFGAAATNIWGVSKNRGTPKSSILMGFSIVNHPFWGTPIFGNTHIPPTKELWKMIFLFPRWDMLVPCNYCLRTPGDFA